MRNFAFGIFATILMVAALAAEGGYSVVWEFEMQRSEAQKAIGHWAQNNCDVLISPYELERLRTDPASTFERLHIECRVDSK